MQTLVFNTTTKTAKLYEGVAEKSELIIHYTDVPTVKVIPKNLNLLPKPFLTFC